MSFQFYNFSKTKPRLVILGAPVSSSALFAVTGSTSVSLAVRARVPSTRLTGTSAGHVDSRSAWRRA